MAQTIPKIVRKIADHRQSLDAVRKGRARLNMDHVRPAAMAKNAPLQAAGAPGARVFRILAQGDSWFNYWIGHDILYWLNHDYGHQIRNIAVAGSTLNDEVYGPVPSDFLDFRQVNAPSRLLELADLIQSDKPQALLISAGGNDIAGDAFFSFLNNSKSGLSPVNNGVLSNVIIPTFEKAYKDMIQAALDAAAAANPAVSMTIFTHGYDYPWPDGRGVLWIRGAIGPWFDPTFNAKNYPNESVPDLTARRDIVRKFIDALNVMLKSLEAAFPGKVYHIDVRNTLQEPDYRNDWANELHPTDSGFQKIAGVFNNVIQAKLP